MYKANKEQSVEVLMKNMNLEGGKFSSLRIVIHVPIDPDKHTEEEILIG